MTRNSSYYGSSRGTIFGSVDWVTVIIYLALVLIGWVNIYAAVFNEDHASMFDMGQKYGSQIFWIGVCSVVGIILLLLDSKYFHYLSYHVYIIMILVLILVSLVGVEVNGSRSWFQVGGFRLQPAEFAKITTALALAKYMSSYGFDIGRMKNIAVVFFIIALPAALIILQNDTGSALVYSSFVLMLYREGFNGWFYLVVILMIVLFIFSFIVETVVLMFLLTAIYLIVEGMMNGMWYRKIQYFALISLLYFLFSIVFITVLGVDIEREILFLIVLAVSLPIILSYIFRNQLYNVFMLIVLLAGSFTYMLSVDYVFENIMKSHQQERILLLLGLNDDMKGAGYNVNQSKIAIGSGGVFGKGFLKGTQTKYDFVPEQSTDFIFCTVSEEWGFVGSAIVIALFVILIIRLMKMGDRQGDAFGRIYCYGAASVFAFHVLINIGMTIGIMPVIGIPLPFFSYGGSSLLAFTILLFIAIRLDSNRKDSMSNFY